MRPGSDIIQSTLSLKSNNQLHLEELAVPRDVIETSPEPLGHDAVEDWVEDGVEVVEDSGDHEQDMLCLESGSYYREAGWWSVI